MGARQDVPHLDHRVVFFLICLGMPRIEDVFAAKELSGDTSTALFTGVFEQAHLAPIYSYKPCAKVMRLKSLWVIFLQLSSAYEADCGTG